MLSPDDRSMLLESLEPPIGYELDSAVALTYTLDLKALLSVPTAFALKGGAGSEESGSESDLTPLAVLNSLRAHVGRLTICCDAAGISLPSSARMNVYAFLERAVVPMQAPRGGVFHPKAWVVRYRDETEQVLHRVLISSRNLTFDRSWDTLVRLDEDAAGTALPGLPRLLEACTEDSMTRGAMPRDHQERLMSVAQSVGKAKFDPPPGFTDMRLHALGLSATARAAWPFPPQASRAMIASPFLKASLLDRFPSPWANTLVVSRSDELDRELLTMEPEARSALLGDTHELQNSGVFTLNPAANEDPMDGSLTGLHAKLFVVDVPGGRSNVYVGSANATAAAFQSNVEVLLEMNGRTRDVGVATFNSTDGMRSLLVSHDLNISDVVPDADLVRQHLDELRHAMGSIAVEAHVTAIGDERWQVQYESETDLPTLAGATLEMRPLTLSTWNSVEPDRPLNFTVTVDQEGISGFLAVRLAEAGQQATMLLHSTLRGVPAGRDQVILARLLADPERLIRYLLMLLADHPGDRFDPVLQEVLHEPRFMSGRPMHTVPLLEVMARALLGPKSKLAEVDRLITELESSSGLIDDNLRALWASMRLAAGLNGVRDEA